MDVSVALGGTVVMICGTLLALNVVLLHGRIGKF
jgi:hypothetical protein